MLYILEQSVSFRAVPELIVGGGAGSFSAKLRPRFTYQLANDV